MTIPAHKGFYTGKGPGAFTIETKGLAELKRALQYLPEEMRSKCIDKALKYGGKEMVNAAKKNIMAISPKLKDLADATTMWTDNKSLNCTVWMGPKLKTHLYLSKKSKGNIGTWRKVKPFWAHMIEWGTAAHHIPKPGKFRKERKALLIPGRGHPIYEVDVKGISGKRPFTRAFDENKEAFVSKFKDYVDKFIKKNFQKMGVG